MTPKRKGMSIAQAEYWPIRLIDGQRTWSTPLVKATVPVAKTAMHLPPSIVLEVLQILEGQVNLREETRVVEQAKKVDALDLHRNETKKISNPAGRA